MNNYEKITSLNMEEMAKFLDTLYIGCCSVCIGCDYTYDTELHNTVKIPYVQRIEEWLRQEAE